MRGEMKRETRGQGGAGTARALAARPPARRSPPSCRLFLPQNQCNWADLESSLPECAREPVKRIMASWKPDE